MESCGTYAGVKRERLLMKLPVVKKTVICPISNESLQVDRCKNCTYKGKIEGSQMECEFK